MTLIDQTAVEIPNIVLLTILQGRSEKAGKEPNKGEFKRPEGWVDDVVVWISCKYFDSGLIK